MRDDFEVGTRLGVIFQRLARFLFAANFCVIGFVVSVFYVLWNDNVYGYAAPYILQICSLTCWAFGAAGLLMLGGNPRVEIDDGKAIPKHISNRLDMIRPGFVELYFGSLHGSVWTPDRGSCFVHSNIMSGICAWKLRLTRTWGWHAAIIWFAIHIGISVVLQVAGARVATVFSQIQGIAVIVVASVIRGRGVLGPEEWMIPHWFMRKNTGYAVSLQGELQARSR